MLTPEWCWLGKGYFRAGFALPGKRALNNAYRNYLSEFRALLHNNILITRYLKRSRRVVDLNAVTSDNHFPHCTG